MGALAPTAFREILYCTHWFWDFLLSLLQNCMNLDMGQKNLHPLIWNYYIVLYSLREWEIIKLWESAVHTGSGAVYSDWWHRKKKWRNVVTSELLARPLDDDRSPPCNMESKKKFWPLTLPLLPKITANATAQWTMEPIVYFFFGMSS